MKKFLLSIFALAGIAGTAFADSGTSADDPLTVSQFLESYKNDNTKVFVRGFIVGSVDGQSLQSGAHFSLEAASNTNILLAQSSTETEVAKCIPVQLPAGDVRTALSLQQNPNNLGHAVILEGEMVNYFTAPGLKNTKSYQWVGEAPEPSGGTTGGTTDGGYLISGMDDFTIENVSLTGDLSYVWSWDNTYGAKASAFLNNTNYEAEAYLISPAITLTADQKSATISQALNFLNGNNRADFVNIEVREGNGAWAAVNVSAWPEGTSWGFVDDCEIDLSAYAGKTIQIGFHYKSTTICVPTWEVKNLQIEETGLNEKVNFDFIDNGIYYRILSPSDLTVGVVTYDESQYQEEIIIPERVNFDNKTYSVKTLCAHSFERKRSKISKINLPMSVEKIEVGAFLNCALLSEIIGGDNIAIVEDSAFYNCSKLQNIQLGKNLKKIGNAVFMNCSELNRLTYWPLLEEIGEQCFSSCYKLNKFIMGPKINSIGKEAFFNCSSLIEVFFLSQYPPYIGTSAFSNTHSSIEKYVPSVKRFGFGKNYLTFHNVLYAYSGLSHNIVWTNNLKAYKCEIPESECIIKENNAGEHTQYLSATYSNGVDFTVDIPYDYTISKAPMTLTVNNVQRVYGEPNPTFSCNITGWVNGENEQTIGITPSFDCEANQRSNVGDYRILASLEAPNYEITYQYGNLSILKAPLAASVINSTKIYGNPNPQFELSFSGLKNGETSPSWEVQPTFNTTATEKSSVGDYEVTASNGDATNYSILSFIPGVLSITKKDLTAKANDCERLYGEENPEFTLSYTGFVNGDSETVLTSTPITKCVATIDSNAGTYPITVNGGSSENYNFIYQDGTLTITPLTIGFKDIYNSVTFDDMSVSVTEEFFYYVPEIFGPYNEEDFWLEMMALDKDNRYPSQHVITISGGDYAGDYINYSTFMLEAGKYIFNLTSKGTNPNVVANPSRAYVTVNRASTNLKWNVSSPIRVKVGEKVDLGISYQADLWCTFNTDYDKELISLSSEGATTRNPNWYATGLKEGRTYLEFSIDCMPNDFGFYDFSDSSTLYKEIIVSGYYEDGIEDVTNDSESTMIVYNLQGVRMNVSTRDELRSLEPGFYIINGKKEIIR